MASIISTSLCCTLENIKTEQIIKELHMNKNIKTEQIIKELHMNKRKPLHNLSVTRL